MKRPQWRAEEPQFGLKLLSDDDNKVTSEIKSESNRIYFYSEVSSESCLSLNRMLQEKANELLSIAQRNGFGKPKIFLHINSFGGSLFDGVSSMDTILRIRKDVDVITIVEGGSASAATFLSVVGTKRWMTENSFMLIHQLSSITWGKYREIKDDMDNCDVLMDLIKRVYFQYTDVPENEIDQILDHDLWWDSGKCLEMGLVDKII